MSRKAVLLLIAILAVSITATSTVVQILFKPLRLAAPILIVDPYDNISAYPYATITAVGNTIAMSFSDTGTVYIVPFVVGFLETPKQTWNFKDFSLPFDVYEVCFNVTIVANNSITIVVPKVDDSNSQGFRQLYGVFGFLVSKEIFDKVGYNTTFDVNTKYRITLWDDVDQLYGVVEVMQCTFFNSTHMNCTIHGYRHSLSGVVGDTDQYYTRWFINKTVIDINGEKFYVYLLDPEELYKLYATEYVSWFGLWYNPTRVSPTYPPDMKLTNLPDSQTQGTQFELRMCVHYSRGSVTGADRPWLLKFFPLYGFYMQLSASLGTGINMTVHDIRVIVAQLK